MNDKGNQADLDPKVGWTRARELEALLHPDLRTDAEREFDARQKLINQVAEWKKDLTDLTLPEFARIRTQIDILTLWEIPNNPENADLRTELLELQKKLVEEVDK